jgi:hypothetical protein
VHPNAALRERRRVRRNTRPRRASAEPTRAGDSSYWPALDRDATLLAALIVIIVPIGVCLCEWGDGRHGSPYSQIAVIGRVAYTVA